MSEPASSLRVDPSKLIPPPKPPVGKGKGDLQEAAQAFEGMLMSLLFQTMRKTVEPSGLFGDSGQARSTFEYLFDQAAADAAARGGTGWGIAKRLEEAWSIKQGTAQSTQINRAVEERP